MNIDFENLSNEEINALFSTIQHIKSKRDEEARQNIRNNLLKVMNESLRLANTIYFKDRNGNKIDLADLTDMSIIVE